ncbi:MAG TPA: 50S ribosomal protein L17 [Candidatus Methylacidiphilales bacterium]
MRHQKKTRKLGRTSQHRDAMLANIVASLIQHKRVKTTLAKAKAARPLAEKLVTLGKGGTLHDRRLAVAKIGQKDIVSKLFKEVAPGFKDRKGGYTRIIKLGPRQSDSAPVAFLEWVDYVVDAEVAPAAKSEKAPKAEKSKAAKADKAENVEVEVVDTPSKKAKTPKE